VTFSWLSGDCDRRLCGSSPDKRGGRGPERPALALERAQTATGPACELGSFAIDPDETAPASISRARTIIRWDLDGRPIEHRLAWILGFAEPDHHVAWGPHTGEARLCAHPTVHRTPLITSLLTITDAQTGAFLYGESCGAVYLST
jgi:hypothetical protein